MNKFIQNLKELRKELGIKQKDFAELCGIKPENLSLYERNIVEPNYETVAKMKNNLEKNIIKLSRLSLQNMYLSGKKCHKK